VRAVAYATQKLALPLIVVAVLLFGFQLVMGALLALYYVYPNILSGFMNFNLIRAYHINALILWLFAATFAAVIFVMPVLAKREVAYPGLVKAVIALLLIATIGGFATLPLMQSGYNIWVLGQPMLYEGKEYVELGRLWDILILLAFTLFAIVVLKTLPPPREWPLALWALVFGAALTFMLYLPGNIFFEHVPTSEYFRWWTVHYWVEGALEVAYVGAFGLLLMVLIPVDKVRKIVDKYVFYDVVLAATSGILGQGHHYFWIGTPTFWIMIGGIFSALEVLPLILMAFESLRVAREAGIKFENLPSMYFMVGILLFGLIGVSLQGLIITWPWTNWWEHGTWVTMLHAHECMMAFAMGAISLVLFAIPGVTGKPIDRTFTVWGKRAFIFMAIGQTILATSFGLAGLPQIYLYWIKGASWTEIMSVRASFMPGVLFGGLLVFLGYMYYAAAVFRHIAFPVSTEPYKPEEKPPTFLNSLRGMPWLILLAVILALLGSAGIASFSTPHVLAGSPLLPFTITGIAYIGLAVLLPLMCIKMARALEYGHLEL
jgi:nitric oxide reductase subunit B